MRDKSVAIDIGGAERRLRFNLNALEAFESYTGKSFAAFRDQMKALPLRVLRVMIWACLVTDEPELKIETVGSWIDLENLQDVTEKLRQVLDRANPKRDEAGAENPPTPAP